MNYIFTILTIVLLFAGPASAETPAEKGLAIAREADRRDEGFVDSTADMLMVLKNRHGQQSTRNIRLRVLEVSTKDER